MERTLEDTIDLSLFLHNTFFSLVFVIFFSCVLEYDVEAFREISFLMEYDKFSLILTSM